MVLGHYRIIREIARSNDVVYEALDTRINRRVAIKELLMPPGATDSVRYDRIARFRREARAAGMLSHPNIVTLFETEEENGRYFIVMEYLEGENLRQRLEREGTIPKEEACEIVLQVLDGLIEAHTHGVIHRDIKPENIHLLPHGRVKITDFGIARMRHEPNITMDGQIFGTPSYMSPEQVQGGEIDERSDLFSVGVVFYEMLTGMKPFTGDSVVTIAYNILHAEPPVVADMHPALAWVIQKALRKAPGDRFQSAREMQQAIENALQQFKLPPVVATPMGPTPTMGGYTLPPTGGAPPITIGSPPPTTGGYSVSVPSGVVTAPPAPAPYVPPPPPPRPLLTPGARQFLGTVLAVMLIGGAILGVVLMGVYASMRAIEEYNLQQADARAAEQAALAEQLYKQKRYLESAEIYRQLFLSAQSSKWKEQFRKNTAIAYTAHGNALLSQRRYEEAGRAYQLALEYMPNLEEALAGMAEVQRQLGNMEGAIRYWSSASQYSRGSQAEQYKRRVARAYLEQGKLAYQQGNLPLALREWQSAVDSAPGTPEAQEAKTLFEQALQEMMRR